MFKSLTTAASNKEKLLHIKYYIQYSPSPQIKLHWCIIICSLLEINHWQCRMCLVIQCRGRQSYLKTALKDLVWTSAQHCIVQREPEYHQCHSHTRYLCSLITRGEKKKLSEVIFFFLGKLFQLLVRARYRTHPKTTIHIYTHINMHTLHWLEHLMFNNAVSNDVEWNFKDS